MANVELTGNFLATARCLIFADSASGVWSFNPNTNTLTITAAGGTYGNGNNGASGSVTGSSHAGGAAVCVVTFT